MKKEINEAVEYIKNFVKEPVDIALVLGSGLGEFADSIENPIIIKYGDVPNFPRSTVAGHKGQFVFGKIGNKNVCIMQGRVHYYEGYPMHQVVFPEYVLAELGAKVLILTNAVGAINENLPVNTFACIVDHLNFTGYNPLIGTYYTDCGVRFPSLNNLYDKDLREIAHNVAKELGVTLGDSVFAQTSGPSYETPAEVRALKILGAETCGMSTAIEAIAGKHAGMKVLAISNISNKAAGLAKIEPTHKEVLENSNTVKEDFKKLLNGIVSAL